MALAKEKPRRDTREGQGAQSGWLSDLKLRFEAFQQPTAEGGSVAVVDAALQATSTFFAAHQGHLDLLHRAGLGGLALAKDCRRKLLNLRLETRHLSLHR
jgi:hypothetical protein